MHKFQSQAHFSAAALQRLCLELRDQINQGLHLAQGPSSRLEVLGSGMGIKAAWAAVRSQHQGPGSPSVPPPSEAAPPPFSTLPHAATQGVSSPHAQPPLPGERPSWGAHLHPQLEFAHLPNRPGQARPGHRPTLQETETGKHQIPAQHAKSLEGRVCHLEDSFPLLRAAPHPSCLPHAGLFVLVSPPASAVS